MKHDSGIEVPMLRGCSRFGCVYRAEFFHEGSWRCQQHHMEHLWDVIHSATSQRDAAQKRVAETWELLEEASKFGASPVVVSDLRGTVGGAGR